MEHRICRGGCRNRMGGIFDEGGGGVLSDVAALVGGMGGLAL